ncbi:glycosyltransferase family 9 protein [Algicola sagamiensis]|uniref:glycosyltransferase family 9 protein n=1 Tax=Algicola sagamiensis TaxID=163869 RepID=UPI00037913A4|nr:glycosyltransferase family 9 protein [Algicola sagamiensis]
MTHLALGDFYYQKTFLKALKKKYPQIQLDIWLEDFKRKKKSFQSGRNTALTDWITFEGFASKIYPISRSQEEFDGLITDALAENYDAVFFVANLRTERFAKYARMIGKQAVVVGTKHEVMNKPLRKLYHFSKLDGHYLFEDCLLPGGQYPHVIELYNYHFQRLVGLSLTEEEKQPTLSYPEPLKEKVHTDLQQWKSTQQLPVDTKVILINHLSSSKKRDWPLESVFSVIQKIHQANEHWCFVINVPPDQLDAVKMQIDQATDIPKGKVLVFTAKTDFFELPAMIDQADVVLTVETAIMHFAQGLGKPMVALVRGVTKHWAPIETDKIKILITEKGRDWVNKIPESAVLEALEPKL